MHGRRTKAVVAGVALVLLAWLVRLARSADVGARVAWIAFMLSLVQALSGALVVWTRLGLFSTLAHAAIMALLFAALAHLAWQVWVADARCGLAFRGRLA